MHRQVQVLSTSRSTSLDRYLRRSPRTTPMPSSCNRANIASSPPPRCTHTTAARALTALTQPPRSPQCRLHAAPTQPPRRPVLLQHCPHADSTPQRRRNVTLTPRHAALTPTAPLHAALTPLSRRPNSSFTLPVHCSHTAATPQQRRPYAAATSASRRCTLPSHGRHATLTPAARCCSLSRVSPSSFERDSKFCPPQVLRGTASFSLASRGHIFSWSCAAAQCPRPPPPSTP